MRRINVLSTVAAVVIGVAASFTSFASEGIDVQGSAISFDVDEEPAHEEPAAEEPTAEEPTPEPTPAPAPEVEPAEEPTPGPTLVVVSEVEPAPAEPTPAPQNNEQEEVAPSSNDDNNESTDDNTSNDVQPVVDNTPAPAPVVEQTVVTPTVVEETPVVATATTVATKATVAKAAAPKAVLGVNRVASVPEDQDIEEVEEAVVEEEESEEGRSLLGALLFAILLGLGALLFFLLGRKYQVVKKTVNADGEEEEILKKFFSIEKACEYVRDYQWDATDDDYDSLKILNKTYDEEYEDENGTTQYNGQYVYVVSEDHAQEAIINASDDEVDAIGRILGFVQEEALA